MGGPPQRMMIGDRMTAAKASAELIDTGGGIAMSAALQKRRTVGEMREIAQLKGPIDPDVLDAHSDLVWIIESGFYMLHH